jgi:phosphopantothenoylcysteine decarboxylase / phosphopantothenate---cysteine ligase
MADAVLGAAPEAAVVVMAAAVADYRPATVGEHRIKNSDAPRTLELVPTLDILAALGAGRQRPGQVLVGFAAETAAGAELVQLGQLKLAAKGADLIVANDVNAPGVGFDQDWSAAVIVSRESTVQLGVVAKRELAAKLVDAIVGLLGAGAGDGILRHEEGAKA